MRKYIIIALVVVFFLLGLTLLPDKSHTSGNKISLDKSSYNSKEIKDINYKQLEKLTSSKSSFLLFVYLPTCTFKVPCESVFKAVTKENNVLLYTIAYTDIKDKEINKKIKYAPSFIIFDKGKIKKYLDPNKDADLEKFQDKKKFEKWLNDYVDLKD